MQEQRVREVLWGKTFEPKHVHLYAWHERLYRRLLDSSKEKKEE
jgi:hypothetical protein